MAGQNIFNSVKMTRPNKSRFDLSFDLKTSFNMGELIPTCALECIPGDRWSIGCESLLRFAPMVAPIMHRVDVYMHYFFVPNRLVWQPWEQYITNGGSSPDPDPLPAFPFIELDNVINVQGSLFDYFGIPRSVTSPVAEPINISAVPFAAYRKIYDEYYRDENLISAWDPTGFPILQNGDNTSLFTGGGEFDLSLVKRRAWEKDYFTSALPFAQKGNVVDLPLGAFADVPVFSASNTGDPADTLVTITAQGNITNPLNQVIPKHAVEGLDVPYASNSLWADTSELLAQSTTINDLRSAFRLQEWLEKNARGGTRYVENILAHFGVRSSDKRLQRPEYITGTKSPVVISEVLNTTGTDDAPQGEMAGHGVSVTQGKYGSYFCEEHGYIIGIMSVMPKPAYQMGIPKHFLKINDPTELAWPSFAHLGEQEIISAELYWEGVAANDNAVFGYTPRYAEYKYMPSMVTGEFRSGVTGSLDFWHMARTFTDQPLLNAEFIECDPTHRIFAVTSTSFDKLYCHIFHKLNVIRALPKFGIPSF